MAELERLLDGGCVDFSQDRTGEAFLEQVVVCDEEVLGRYLETGTVADEEITALIAGR